MKPVNFPQSNRTLTPPPGVENCEPLPVLAEEGALTSVWELEPGEMTQLIISRRIALTIYGGQTHAPVVLQVVGNAPPSTAAS